MYMNELTSVFKQFKNKEGRFEEKRGNDIRGLTGLYEASQLRVKKPETLAVKPFQIYKNIKYKSITNKKIKQNHK